MKKKFYQLSFHRFIGLWKKWGLFSDANRDEDFFRPTGLKGRMTGSTKVANHRPPRGDLPHSQPKIQLQRRRIFRIDRER